MFEKEETLYGLTVKEWMDLVIYDQVNGGLIWQYRAEHLFKTSGRCAAWNKRYGNKPCGGINTWKGKSYRKLRHKDKKLRVCRIVYFIHTGVNATIVDHIDGDSLNDKIENLRNVTIQENNENKVRPMITNTTGYLGVSQTESGKYCAQITVKGDRKFLGLFECPVKAHEEYVKAKRLYHAGCTL